MTFRIKNLGLSALAAAVLMACGGGSNNGSVTPPGASAGATYSGVAMAGNISNADVEVYALNANGSLGSLIGKGVTSADGAFSITTTSKSDMVAIKVKGAATPARRTPQRRLMAASLYRCHLARQGKQDWLLHH